MPRHPFPIAALLALALGGATLRAQDVQEVSLPAVASTSIFSAFYDNDFGDTTLVAGTNGNYYPARALFSFDLSSIPAGATIDSVSLGIVEVNHPTTDKNGYVNSNFDIYSLLVPWGEGSGTGNDGTPAETGDATWYYNQYGISTWSVPGGQAGVDFGDDPISTAFVGANLGETYVWNDTQAFVSTVQGWLDDPTTNFGLILISEGEDTATTGRRFASVGDPDGYAPPTLTVDYTVAPEPGTGLLLVLGGAAGMTRGGRRNSSRAGRGA